MTIFIENAVVASVCAAVLVIAIAVIIFLGWILYKFWEDQHPPKVYSDSKLALDGDFVVVNSWTAVYLITIPSIKKYRIELDKSIKVYELGVMSVVFRSIQYIESLDDFKDKDLERKYLIQLCESYDALITGRHNKKRCIDEISRLEHAMANPDNLNKGLI
jgi:hypothetical protein